MARAALERSARMTGLVDVMRRLEYALLSVAFETVSGRTFDSALTPLRMMAL